MSNVKCQIVRYQMSNNKHTMSDVKCQMSNAYSEDIVRSQKILGDLRRSCEISVDLVRSQLCCIIIRVCRLG